ncbi:hypothetical protein FHR81_002222 [Actinoalloteichus hoggarensis]|uniref:Uncharacterized protein n=1 Tax=Actinoalloteichus hoggarensis TaxID=1470176 RepID=A0A221W5N2_9PSEU|nr:hypothetical protein AHOG_18135 [Actinoalloteichus hoggarensis]MBB5921184.1 hypothetical protein [Actinoalloteichus hoggarensis]
MAVSSALDAVDQRPKQETGSVVAGQHGTAAIPTRKGDSPISPLTDCTAMPFPSVSSRTRTARRRLSAVAVMRVRSWRTRSTNGHSAADRSGPASIRPRGHRPTAPGLDGRRGGPDRRGTPPNAASSQDIGRTAGRGDDEGGHIGPPGTAVEPPPAGRRHRPRHGGGPISEMERSKYAEFRIHHFSAAAGRPANTTSGGVHADAFDGVRSVPSEPDDAAPPCPYCDTCNNRRVHPLGIDTNVRLCRVPEELIMKQEKTSKNFADAAGMTQGGTRIP